MEDSILIKAKQILEDRKRDSIIIKAGLCPKCGELLTHFETEYVYGKECPIDKEHYHKNKRYYDYD